MNKFDPWIALKEAIKRQNPWVTFFCGLFLLGILIGGFIASIYCKGWASSEAAGWAQAIGAIIAIAGAFDIARQQNRAAAQEAILVVKRTADRRRQAIKAIVEHARDEAVDIQDLVFAAAAENRPFEMLGYSFKETATSLAAIPFHELDSAHEVSALFGLITALNEAHGSINRDAPSETTLRDAFKRIAIFADRYCSAVEKLRDK